MSPGLHRRTVYFSYCSDSEVEVVFPPDSVGACLEAWGHLGTSVAGTPERVHCKYPVGRGQGCQGTAYGTRDGTKGQPVVHGMAPKQRIGRTQMSKAYCFISMT